MEVSSHIRLNTSTIRAVQDAFKRALVKTAEYLHTEVVQSQKMPFDTGNLQNESTFVDSAEVGRGTVFLVTSTPYARRLYFHPEYNFQTHENPDAGGEWLVDWDKGGAKAEDLTQTFAEFLKQEV